MIIQDLEFIVSIEKEITEEKVKGGQEAVFLGATSGTGLSASFNSDTPTEVTAISFSNLDGTDTTQPLVGFGTIVNFRSGEIQST